jgi:hypothetical protein
VIFEAKRDIFVVIYRKSGMTFSKFVKFPPILESSRFKSILRHNSHDVLLKFAPTCVARTIWLIMSVHRGELDASDHSRNTGAA